MAYYFDAHLNTTPGVPDDPNSAWLNKANAFTLSLADDATSNTLLGSTSTNYLYGKGTNAPGTGLPIREVNVRLGNNRPGNATVTNAVVYTSGLAQALGTVSVSNGGGFHFGPYATLSVPTGGWTWPVLQALEVKAYDSSGDGTFSASLTIIELQVLVYHNVPGNYGAYAQVGDGMGRSEVAN